MKNLYQQIPSTKTKFIFQEKNKENVTSVPTLSEAQDLHAEVHALTDVKKAEKTPKGKLAIITKQLDGIKKIVSFLQTKPLTPTIKLGTGLTSLSDKPLALDYYQALQEALLKQATQSEKEIITKDLSDIRQEILEWKAEKEEDSKLLKEVKKDSESIEKGEKRIEDLKETKTARSEAVSIMSAFEKNIQGEIDKIDEMIAAMSPQFEIAEAAVIKSIEEIKRLKELAIDIEKVFQEQKLELEELAKVKNSFINEATISQVEGGKNIKIWETNTSLETEKENLANAKGAAFDVTVDGVTKAFTYGEMKNKLQNEKYRKVVLNEKLKEYQKIADKNDLTDDVKKYVAPTEE